MAILLTFLQPCHRPAELLTRMPWGPRRAGGGGGRGGGRRAVLLLLGMTRPPGLLRGLAMCQHHGGGAMLQLRGFLFVLQNISGRCQMVPHWSPGSPVVGRGWIRLDEEVVGYDNQAERLLSLPAGCPNGPRRQCRRRCLPPGGVYRRSGTDVRGCGVCGEVWSAASGGSTAAGGTTAIRRRTGRRGQPSRKLRFEGAALLPPPSDA